MNNLNLSELNFTNFELKSLLVSSIAEALSELSSTWAETEVVVTNQMTTVIGQKGDNSIAPSVIRPCLGSVWSNKIRRRIVIERGPTDNLQSKLLVFKNDINTAPLGTLSMSEDSYGCINIE